MSAKQAWWSVAILLVFVAVGWWFWRESDLDRLQALQAQMRDESFTPEARRALGQQFREGMRSLAPADRERFFANAFGGRMRRDLDAYFNLTPKQRIAYLDREIKQSEQRRKQFAARGNGGPPGGFGGPGGGNRSPAEREAARKRRLDFSSAEDRAQQAEYRRQMNERRSQLGMSPSGRG